MVPYTPHPCWMLVNWFASYLFSWCFCPTESSSSHPGVHVFMVKLSQIVFFFSIPWLCKGLKKKRKLTFSWLENHHRLKEIHLLKKAWFSSQSCSVWFGGYLLVFKDPSGIGFPIPKHRAKKWPPSKVTQNREWHQFGLGLLFFVAETRVGFEILVG